MPRKRPDIGGYEGQDMPREQGPDIPNKAHSYVCNIETWLNDQLLVVVTKDGEIWRTILAEDQEEAEWISNRLTGTRPKVLPTSAQN